MRARTNGHPGGERDLQRFPKAERGIFALLKDWLEQPLSPSVLAPERTRLPLNAGPFKKWGPSPGVASGGASKPVSSDCLHGDVGSSAKRPSPIFVF